MKPAQNLEQKVRRGRFVVLEGLDGAGTTTQARLLQRWWKSHLGPLISTAEPSKGPIGTFLRAAMGHRIVQPDGARLDPKAIAALFSADRADHLATEIEPALASGVDVLCDRYVGSSLAYQGRECEFDWVKALNAPYPEADITLYLRVSPEIAAERRAVRKNAAELYEIDQFQRLVAEAYDRILQPGERVFVIDGERSVREIQRRCREILLERLQG